MTGVIGALALKGSKGICHPQDPSSLFQVIFHSGDPPFQAPFQLQRPHFYFLKKKKCIFKPNFLKFWLNFSSRDTSFSKILFPRPQFQAKKISSRDSTFENLGDTYLPKNYLSDHSSLFPNGNLTFKSSDGSIN